MAVLDRWSRTAKLRALVAVVAVAVVAGGTVLGLELSGGSGSPSGPSTAAAGSGSGTSGGGSGSANDAGGKASSGTGSSDGDSSAGAGPGSSSGSGGGATTTSLGPQRMAVLCTVVSGNVTGVITMSSCSHPTITGGSGTFPGSLLAKSGSGTVTWSGTGTSSFVYVIAHPANKRRKCPGLDTQTTLRGAVVANAPLGTGNAGVKGPVHVRLCVDPRLDVSLAAGKAAQF